MRATKRSQERDGNTKYERIARALRLPEEDKFQQSSIAVTTRSLVERVWDAIIESPHVSEIGTSARFLGMKCNLHSKKISVILLLLVRAGRITVDEDLVRLVKR